MATIRNQDYALVPVGELRPHPANPRKGDLGAIARSVQVNGFYGAVVAQRGTGYILAGNHRWRAARGEGLRQVPVLWVDCTDEDARRILLADNRTNDVAGYDEDALAKLLDGMRAGEGLEGTGWTPEAFDQLIAGLGNAVMGGVPEEEQFPALPTGDKSPFQQMTFTLHDQQADTVKRALAIAKNLGADSAVNANSNGNALARICEDFVTAHGEG